MIKELGTFRPAYQTKPAATTRPPSAAKVESTVTDRFESSEVSQPSATKVVMGVLGGLGVAGSVGMLVAGAAASAPLLGLGLLLGGLGLLSAAFPSASSSSESPATPTPVGGAAPFEVNGQRFTASGEAAFDMGNGFSVTPTGALVFN